MRISPVTGLLSIFALMIVGLIAGLSAIGSGSSQLANTYFALETASSTPFVTSDPSRNTYEDGSKRTNELRATSTNDVADVPDDDDHDIQIVAAPVPRPETTPTTTVSPPVPTTTAVTSVQANDSAPRVLIPTPVPAPTGSGSEGTTVVQPRVVSEKRSERAESEQSKERIRDIGSSLREFQREIKRVENVVRERVTREVETAIQTAELSSTKRDVTPTRPFDIEERQKRIQELTSKISQDVRSAIVVGAGGSESQTLQPVLRSSLDEIRLLIRADTGVDVDLSPSARTVLDVVDENTSQVAKVRNELFSREGLDLYADNDKDGISDYDERHIYKTDPLSAYTAGSSLTDGERVLLGFNPLSDDFSKVPVESPRVAGEVVENVYEVHSISVALSAVAPDEVRVVNESSDVSEAQVPVFTEAVTFTGRALPNSFVTLYVFSTPVVVTVKADASGAWSYTLETELEDGNHELYVATVDAGGRILAKSPSVPFVKRAEAAEFTPLLIPETPDVTPLSLLRENFTLIGVVAFIVFALIALIILGVLRSGPKEPTLAR